MKTNTLLSLIVIALITVTQPARGGPHGGGGGFHGGGFHGGGGGFHGGGGGFHGGGGHFGGGGLGADTPEAVRFHPSIPCRCEISAVAG